MIEHHLVIKTSSWARTLQNRAAIFVKSSYIPFQAQNKTSSCRLARDMNANQRHALASANAKFTKITTQDFQLVDVEGLRLYIDAAMRVVRAPAASAVGAAAVAVPVTMDVSLAVVGLAISGACPISMEPGQDGSKEEKDTVHDAKGEASLEHGTSLVDSGVDAVV